MILLINELRNTGIYKTLVFNLPNCFEYEMILPFRLIMVTIR